ncbi:MAG: TIGR04255 family protein [Elusimicrobiaceae bacterium]|nr:TIGR04255 family protein [Elusimicrobiaceae bacterium]
MSTFQSLKHSPIKETSIGVSLKRLFSKRENLDLLQESLNKDFPFCVHAGKTSVSFDDKKRTEPNFSHSVNGIHVIAKDRKQLLILEQESLRLRSKIPYQNFETTFQNFLSCFKRVSQNASDMILGEDAILEYENRFTFPIQETNSLYRILPCIQLPPQDFSLNQFTGIYKTEKTNGVKASVVSELLANGSNVDVRLIISTQKNQTGLSADNFDETFLELNQTACEIFFNNLTEKYIKMDENAQ